MTHKNKRRNKTEEINLSWGKMATTPEELGADDMNIKPEELTLPTTPEEIKL